MVQSLLETKKRRRRCTCPRGHAFVGDITVSIEISTDPDEVDLLNDKGEQLICCPTCGQSWHIAEPVCISNRKLDTFALFVPEALSHRELCHRAELAQRLADADEEDLPSCLVNFNSIVGYQALQTWIDGQDTEKKEKNAVPSASPGIHRAFADLVSIMPAAPGDTSKKSDDD